MLKNILLAAVLLCGVKEMAACEYTKDRSQIVIVDLFNADVDEGDCSNRYLGTIEVSVALPEDDSSFETNAKLVSVALRNKGMTPVEVYKGFIAFGEYTYRALVKPKRRANTKK